MYNIEIRLTRNAVLGVFGFLLVTALSVALVTALYNIRINHYRFEYGIYMTFGADFRRLMSVCVWEMLVVAAVVYVPAVIASWLISLAVYKASGLSYSYNAAAPLLVLLFSLLVSVLSVCVPVWRLSRRTPRSNISPRTTRTLWSPRGFRLRC